MHLNIGKGFLIMGEKDEVKQALKEAIKEWLDERFLEFGKWSFGALTAATLAALTYFVLKMNGWTKLG